MHRSSRILPFILVVAIAVTSWNLVAAQRNNHKEPKSEVLPLPKELPMALAAETATLEFRALPLLQSGGLAAQIRQSVSLLLRDTRKEDAVIKLRAFVAGPGDARRVQSVVTESFGEHKLHLPVVSIVEVGALQDSRAQVAMEATISTRKQLNPNGLVFLSGQTGDSLDAALNKLRASALSASAGNILRATCFVSRIGGEGPAMQNAVITALPGATVTVIQALRDPMADAATCEAIAQAKPPASSPASPVLLFPQARATVVRTDRLIFTGLQLSFGNYLDDAQEAFDWLTRTASAIDPVETPVQVTAFSPDPSSMAALRKTTHVPLSIFTVQPVQGLQGADASAGVEETLAPGVAAAAVQ
jgi:hypothetical protein